MGSVAKAATARAQEIVARMNRAPFHAFESATTTSAGLHGGTLDGSIRAEHAAVALLRAQQSVASLALVEIDARVGGHPLVRAGTAIRTGDERVQRHFHASNRAAEACSR